MSQGSLQQELSNEHAEIHRLEGVLTLEATEAHNNSEAECSEAVITLTNRFETVTMRLREQLDVAVSQLDRQKSESSKVVKAMEREAAESRTICEDLKLQLIQQRNQHSAEAQHEIQMVCISCGLLHMCISCGTL